MERVDKRKRTMRDVLIGVLLLCLGVQVGWAWGREGHRLTALVAEAYLTPEAKVRVAQLLGNETLADVAPWADAYRVDHPETGPWHFVDIPLKEGNFDRKRDCPVSKVDPKSPWRDCVTDRIFYFEGRLGDESLSTEERAFALKFLVHLIGDIHQPFHAVGDARGGNDIAVSFLGSSMCDSYNCNLHGVWDSMIIEEQGLNEKKYTQRLLREIKDNQWEQSSGGEPTTWANLSHQFAEQAMVPSGALITREYVQKESKIVDAQLALAGLRIAHVLNRILVAPSSQVAPAVSPVVTP